MLNSSAPQQEDCKEYRSSCVLILISKDEYTNINTTKEFGAAFICKKKQYGQRFRCLQILWNVTKKLQIGSGTDNEKRNRNIKNIFIMLQKDTNIMANQVKTPI